MRFGISTHLFHDQRLSRDHLAQIAAHGFEAVEVFATRSHFDYHDPAAIAQLGEWLKETGLALHGIHAPIVESLQRRGSVGRRDFERRRRHREAAGGGARSGRGAEHRAPDPGRRVRRAPRHADGAGRREQPHGGVPQRRGHLPAGRADRHPRRARGDPEPAVGRAPSLVDDARAGSRCRRGPASASISATRS